MSSWTFKPVSHARDGVKQCLDERGAVRFPFLQFVEGAERLPQIMPGHCRASRLRRTPSAGEERQKLLIHRRTSSSMARPPRHEAANALEVVNVEEKELAAQTPARTAGAHNIQLRIRGSQSLRYLRQGDEGARGRETPQQDDIIEAVLRSRHAWDPPWKRKHCCPTPGPPVRARPAAESGETTDPGPHFADYAVDPPGAEER